MVHNRFSLLSFLFACTFLQVFNIDCAQNNRRKQYAFQHTSSVQVIAAEDASSCNTDNKSMDVHKIAARAFRLISDTGEALVSDDLVCAMIKEAETATTGEKSCVVEFKKQYYTVKHKQLLSAINSAEPSVQPPQEKPQKSIHIPKEEPQKAISVASTAPKEPAPILPISPDQFKLPHQHLKPESTVDDLYPRYKNDAQIQQKKLIEQSLDQQKEESEKAKFDYEKKVEERKIQQKKEIDLNYQEKLEEKLAQQKQENKDKLSGLNMYYQEKYLIKIDSFVAGMPNDTLQINIDTTEDLNLLNATLKQAKVRMQGVDNQEVNKDQYHKIRFNEQVEKHASWDIEQFKEYNKALKENGQSPVTYQQFHNICSLKIRKKADTGPIISRFTTIHQETERQLKIIKKIDKETQQIRDFVDNNFAIETFAAAKDTATNILLIEALSTAALGLASYIPNKQIEDCIIFLKKQNNQLDTIISQKKEIFSLLQEEASMQEKKMARVIGVQIQANQKMIDKISGKTKTKEEKIKDLKEQLQKQRNKYA